MNKIDPKFADVIWNKAINGESTRLLMARAIDLDVEVEAREVVKEAWAERHRAKFWLASGKGRF